MYIPTLCDFMALGLCTLICVMPCFELMHAYLFSVVVGRQIVHILRCCTYFVCVAHFGELSLLNDYCMVIVAYPCLNLGFAIAPLLLCSVVFAM